MSSLTTVSSQAGFNLNSKTLRYTRHPALHVVQAFLESHPLASAGRMRGVTFGVAAAGCDEFRMQATHRTCRKCGCQGSSSYRAAWYWCLGATTSGRWVWRHISHPICNPLLAKLCQEWMSHKMSLGSRQGYCESFSFASCGPVCKACTGRLWLLLPQQSHYGRVGVRLGLCPADAKIQCTLPVTGRWPKLSCGQQPCQPQQASACSMEDPLEQRWYAMGSWSLVHTIWFWKGKIHAAMLRWMLFSKLARQLAHMIFLTVSFTQLASLAQCAGEQCSGPGLVVHS